MPAGKKKAVLLRIPPELWEDLNVWARDELRSVNAQIEFALREALQRRKRSREKSREYLEKGRGEDR